MSIGTRIKKERHRLSLNQEAFSTLIGASKRVVISWEKNDAVPNGKYLVAMSEHGADVQYILTGNRSINLHGTGQDFLALHSARSIQAHTQGLVRAVHAAGGDPIPPDLRGALAEAAAAERPGTRPVDVVELASAAGGGAEVLSEDVIGRLWFRRDWLDEHGLDATQCIVLGVHGDSMQPTLAPGAKILINRAARQHRTNRIYVMCTDDGVIVKRLRKASRNWCLVSDNKDKAAWPDITMPAQAEIIGQVVWTARTL